ncbi:MAG: peptidylprolyl isomerase [Epulopiscium sp.]|nr:peptidylprolyl isomerase [Candidatus Epulonipiscium sp.]
MTKKLIYSLSICFFLSGCSRLNIKASTYQRVENPIVTMSLEDGQKIMIELYPDKAPNTVNNFISLIEDGYYDGLTFHRIIEDYIVQGGDPLMNNYGSPGYTIKGEFKANGFKNNLRHTKGIVSMARASDYDSAGSQFFITLDDSQMLNGSYAGFGRVIEGMDVVEYIARAGLDKEDTPPIIEEVIVDTKMVQYPEPQVIPLK